MDDDEDAWGWRTRGSRCLLADNHYWKYYQNYYLAVADVVVAADYYSEADNSRLA